MATLGIKDESTSGKTLRSTTIELPAEQVTVEELIRGYIFQRVKDSNLERTNVAPSAPLVSPTDEEIALNGVKPAKSNPVDWQTEFDKSKQAFQKHQILVFVNEQQMDSLDAIVTIGPSTDVKFLRLTMLMGG